jgi:hypothetical protein
MRHFLVIAVLTLALPAAAIAAPSQRPQPAAPDADAPGITPGEVQRMFDAWVLVQAQDALNLNDAQYGSFVSRLKALQDTRRRHLQARAQLVADLRRALNQRQADDSMLRDRLKALADEDVRAAAELRQALDGVDAVLDVRQQARFRLFEERMEARKLELLLKARQNARLGRGRS